MTLKKGDVLICRTNGNPKLVGKAAIVPKDVEYAFASYLFRIRPNYKKILPTTLTIYLNSKIGRAEINKYLMVSNQANFSPAKFREILIPKFGHKIQSIIDNYVSLSFQKHELSKNFYQQAQDILLAELRLKNWKPAHRLTFVKRYSETQQAERMDAEYFQPKYDDIIDAIKAYKGGWDTLRNVCSLVGHPSNPPYAQNDNDNNIEKTFIVAQKYLGDYTLSDNYWNTDDAKYTTDEFVKNNTQYILIFCTHV